MTVKELKAALARVYYMHDDCNVAIFLPGSRIDLTQLIGVVTIAHNSDPNNVELLIEGTIREGSVLCATT